MSATIDIIKTIPANEFTAVSISCSAANLTVCESPDDLVHIECKNVPDGSFAEIRSGVLRVKIKDPDILDKVFNNLFTETVCKISLPAKLSDSFNCEDKIYDDFSLDIGVGNSSISGFSCARASFKTGAGNCHITDVHTEKLTKLECGVGNVTVDNFDSGSLEIRSGTGNVTIKGSLCGLDIQGGIGNIRFEGRVNGDIDVRGGIGNIDLKLYDRHEGEHKLRTEHGIGRVNVEYV